MNTFLSWALILRSMVKRGADHPSFLKAIATLERKAQEPYQPRYAKRSITKAQMPTLEELGLIPRREK